MNQKIWDLYAPVYEKAMRLDRRYYQYMYDRTSSPRQKKKQEFYLMTCTSFSNGLNTANYLRCRCDTQAVKCIECVI